MRSFVLWIGATLLCGGLASTVVNRALAEEHVRELVVDAAAEVTPALRYRLLPSSVELKRGNAAPIYLRLIHEREGEFIEELAEKMANWSEMELDELPVDEARQLLANQWYYLDQMHFAALREDCQWEYTVGEVNPVELRLPELQQMRRHAQMLGVKARLEILDGDFDQAMRTLSDGFALARHVGRTPILVNTLVANALSRYMANRVEEVISQPGAPNLYWAIAAMQGHPVDITRALEWEMTLLTQIFPELNDLNRQRTPEQWQAIVDRMEAWLAKYEQELLSVSLLADAGDGSDEQAEEALQVQTSVPQARERLVSRGRHTAEDVAAMSDAEVTVRYVAYVAELISAEELKWAYLPYWQSVSAAEYRNRDWEALARELEVLPFSKLLIPASSAGRLSQMTSARAMAVLQLIESLREFAATHDGEWPTTLESLRLPAPLDPSSGKPFEYSVAEGVATIGSAAPPGRETSQLLYYRLTLRK